MYKPFLWIIIFCTLFHEVHAKYRASQCSDLKTYLKYLETTPPGTLEKHPKCNAFAIKTAMKSKAGKEKWIETIEGAYQAYFGYPSAIFTDCKNCTSSAPLFNLPAFKQKVKGDYVLVLSIDGGGVRGLIPAKVLQHLEGQMGQPVHEIFDLFVGTSTGGLISLMLNVPDEQGRPRYTISEVVQLYKNLSQKIFKRGTFLRGIRSRFSLTSKYSTKPYEQLLRQYFGNVTMRHTYKPVVVTSIDSVHKTPFYFSTIGGDFGFIGMVRFMWEAARATSAAPIYFKPFYLKSGARSYTLIDGGVGINNPSIIGVMLAKTLFPNKKIILVSMSTGTKSRETNYKGSGPLGGGLFSFKRKNLSTILANLLDVPSSQNHKFTESLLKSEGGVYYRIRSDDASEIQMDDASPQALKALEKISDNIIMENKTYRRLLVVLPSILNLRSKISDSKSEGRVRAIVKRFEQKAK